MASAPGRLLERRRTLAALSVMLLPAASFAAPAVRDDAIEVDVKPHSEGFEIRVYLIVAAPVWRAWNVLTDFDGMADIVSNLESSRVLSRSGNRLIVEQAGSEAEGPFRIAFHSVREVEFTPKSEMYSRLIRGSMRRLEGWTRLSELGRGTLVESQGTLDGGWAPPLIAPHFIARATRRQYAEMRAEMLRRAGKDRG